MAKYMPDSVLDAMLDKIGAADRLFICTGQPSTYAEASGSKNIATATLASAFSKADSSASGRKLVLAAQSAIPASAPGTADHWAIGISGTSTLLLVGTMTAKSVASGDKVDFPQAAIAEVWDYGAPSGTLVLVAQEGVQINIGDGATLTTGSSRTYYAASPALADVQAAVNLASNGDTVSVPAGIVTDNGNVMITKSLRLLGAGPTRTVINRTAAGNGIKFLLSSDVPIRMSGFGFVNTGGGNNNVIVQGSVPLSQVRLDYITFTGGSAVLWLEGQIYGVADHVSWHNAVTSYLVGNNNAEWVKAYNRGSILAGTSEAFFFEDCDFYYDDNLPNSSPDALLYIQEGFNAVARYCTGDSTGFTKSWSGFCFLNTHANQSYGTGGFRGSPICEMYNNNFRMYNSAAVFGTRGGSLLVHDNTLVSTGGAVYLGGQDEEEAWQTLMFSPVRTAWPAQDQVFNSFYWANTLNGNPIYPTVASGATAFIQQDRDYFLHAPQATGGYEYFTGTRYGGSQTAPTQSDTGSMTFSASGPNAYYPYAPYTYPHPFRSDPFLGD